MKPAYNLLPFYASIFLFREDQIRGQKGPMEDQVLSALQTTLGENRALNGVYEPKEKLLISVGKFVWNRRLWKGTCLSNCGSVEGGILKGAYFYRER
jgi:hypothetical protein